jgi:hypothetical protein
MPRAALRYPGIEEGTSMSELKDLLERFRRGAELIATAMTGAAGAELDFTPAPGKWSPRQIVAHLADSEIVGADRFRRIIAEDNPTLMAYDQNAWAANLDYGRRKTSESIETFRRLRAENYELIKDLPEPVFERTGNHSERGPITLQRHLELMASHAESHARQIRDVREVYKQQRKAHA